MDVYGLFHFFADGCANATFFGIPPWYEYLVAAKRMVTTVDSVNHITSCDLVNGFQWQNGGDLVLIALGILDIALHLAGLIAFGFVVYGGIQYITSDGSPDKTKEAQSTIINALVGFVIAIIASAVVSFIGHRVG